MTDTVEVVAPTFTTGGGITARQLVYTAPGGQGTIQNPDGDVVLSSPLKFNGQNLAILAAGNIVATSKATLIDLSSSKVTINSGNGGALTMIAGFDFTSSGASTGPVSGTFTIGSATENGGSILLPNVKINTSSLVSSGNLHAGAITAIAHGGTVNSGSVILNNITATANKVGGVGGAVRIIADGGIVTGVINTSAAGGGSVNLLVATPTVIGGTVSVTDGVLGGTGTFGAVIPTNAVGTIKTGNITTSGAALAGGNVIATASGGIKTGTIAAVGFKDLIPSVGQPYSAGGVVQLTAGQGSIATGAINAYATNLPKANSNTAGSGGSVILLGANISVAGSIDAHGASTAGTGAGGLGGQVGLLAPSGDPLFLPSSAISVKGGISVVGGNVPASSAAQAGAGGLVTIDGGTATVGILSGYSVNAAGGTGGPGPIAPGSVAITTYSTQRVPSNFDLTSTKKTEYAIPGALFTFNAGTPVNGIAGAIKTDAIYRKANVSGGSGLLFGGDIFNPNTTLFINVVGNPTQNITLSDSSTLPITVASATGVRTKITPAEALALYQVTHAMPQTLTVNATTLASNGGTVEINQSALPQSFTAFKMGSGLTLNLTGDGIVLKLPTATAISGNINFTESGATSLIDFGKGSPTITGNINSDGTLILTGTGSKWTYTGGISAADAVAISRTTTGALTLLASGASAGINAPSILLSPSLGSGLAINFVAQQANFNSPVEFGQIAVPAKYDTIANAAAKNYTLKPVVNLTFALTDNGGNAITPEVGGTVGASTLSLKGLTAKVGTTTLFTPLTITAGSVLNADKSIALSAAGTLTINGSLTAGVAADGVPLTGVLAPNQILVKGTINIISGATTGPGEIVFGGSSSLVVNGGDLKVTQKLAASDIRLDGSVMRARGGNVVVLSKGDIIGASTASLFSQAVGTTAANQKGGGVEVAAGTNTSKLSTILKLPSGTEPSVSIGGNVDIINGLGTHGVVQGIVGNGGTIDISNSGPPGSVIDVVSGGAVLFQGQTGKEISLPGLIITTAAFKPVAYRPTSNGYNALFNPEESSCVRTAFGDIEVKAGALVSISREANGDIRVTALSGPGDVSIKCGAHRIDVHPGHEVLLTSDKHESDIGKADGVGRRNFSRHTLPGGVVVHECEVSMVTFIANAGVSNKSLKERMLKTAAAVYLVSGTKGGAYTARR